MKCIFIRLFLQGFFVLKPTETAVNYCSTMKNCQSQKLETKLNLLITAPENVQLPHVSLRKKTLSILLIKNYF